MCLCTSAPPHASRLAGPCNILSYFIILYSIVKLYMVGIKSPDNSQRTFDMLHFS